VKEKAATRDNGALRWCPMCGDVKACFHRPDEIVTEAYWHEMRRAAKPPVQK